MKTKNGIFQLYIIYVVFILMLSSCNSQEISVEDVKGNWYPLEKDNSTRYIEIYIDDEKFHYYDGKIGILPSKKFSIKDNTLFLENFETDKLEKMATLRKSKDKLFFENNNEVSFILKRLDEKPSLQDLIDSRVQETDFRNSLRSRKNKWNDTKADKNGNKIGSK